MLPPRRENVSRRTKKKLHGTNTITILAVRNNKTMSETKYFEIEEDRYLIEYSDRDSCFHLNDGYNEPNVNSYQTIMENVTIEEFYDFMGSLPKNDGLSVAFLLEQRRVYSKSKNQVHE